jgi:magnesium chelatase family protein
VVAARARQQARLHGVGIALNAEVPPRQLRRLCKLGVDAARLLAAAMSRLGLSARGHDRALRVARTIADLAGADTIGAEHCAEAVQYRSLDRSWRA